MRINILGTENFELMAENDAEIALLDYWVDEKVAIKDVSTENDCEPKTLSLHIEKSIIKNQEGETIEQRNLRKEFERLVLRKDCEFFTAKVWYLCPDCGGGDIEDETEFCPCCGKDISRGRIKN